MFRLARTQNDLAALHEARLLAAEARIASLRAERSEIASLSQSAHALQLGLAPMALRKMAEIDESLQETSSEAEAMRQRLVAARTRQKAFSAKATLLTQAMERKSEADDALEAALGMVAKACGKQGVVK